MLQNKGKADAETANTEHGDFLNVSKRHGGS
jgi:hypothetical protein